jgi:hypothetical protein
MEMKILVGVSGHKGTEEVGTLNLRRWQALGCETIALSPADGSVWPADVRAFHWGESSYVGRSALERFIHQLKVLRMHPADFYVWSEWDVIPFRLPELLPGYFHGERVFDFSGRFKAERYFVPPYWFDPPTLNRFILAYTQMILHGETEGEWMDRTTGLTVQRYGFPAWIHLEALSAFDINTPECRASLLPELKSQIQADELTSLHLVKTRADWDYFTGVTDQIPEVK